MFYPCAFFLARPVLETPRAALATIGGINQQVNIKEPGGQHGDVAAWVVQMVRFTAPFGKL